MNQKDIFDNFDDEIKYRFMEMDWEKSLPKFTLRYISDTFPEAKGLLELNLRIQINHARMDLREAERIEKEMLDLIYRKIPKEDELWWKIMLDGYLMAPLRKGREALIKRNTAFLDRPTGKAGAITDDMIAKAKEFPIPELIEIKRGFSTCIFHDEKTASMKYYKEGNRIFCFGCQKHADSIEVFMRLNGGSFHNAVLKLQ